MAIEKNGSRKNESGQIKTGRRIAVENPLDHQRDGTAPSASDVYRIVYVSRCALRPGRFGSPEAISDILTSSRRNNAAIGITGALAFNGEYFAQVLEGERDVVVDLMQRVERDARHSDVLVVDEGWVKQRDFGGWAMAYVDAPGEKEIPVSGKRFNEILVSDSGRGRDVVEMLKYLVHEGGAPSGG